MQPAGLVGGFVKAAGLNAFPLGYCGPNRYKGFPGTTSGLILVIYPAPNLKKILSVMSTGVAEWAWMTFWSDQPRRIAFVKAFIFGAGTSYVTPAENAFRMSKLEGPRFASGLTAGAAVLEPFPKEPAEASSIE